MATGQNPVYNPATGQLVYPDGSVVSPSTRTRATIDGSNPTENICGTIGCCSRVVSYAIPTVLLVEAFRDGVDPVTASHDPRIVFTTRGTPIARPREFGTTQILRAAQQAVGWGLIPHSPFAAAHRTFMTTPEFDAWAANNRPTTTAADVPVGAVDAVRAWVLDSYGDETILRATLAYEVEQAAEKPRVTLIEFLVGLVPGLGSNADDETSAPM